VTPSYAALFRAPHTALMVAALGATFLGSLDALMVTTALPSAAQDIGGVDLIAVTVGATTVAIAMTFPLAGAVIDREGVGRSFAIACTLFAVANVLGGLAPSMPIVAVSRAILGLGAGFMFAVPLGLFAVSIPDALRPRAFGINAAMWGVSALIGPALGAALTATVGWRWVFWINLPLIAVVAWSAARALRGMEARERPARDAPLNLVGPALLGLVVAVLLALTKSWLPAELLAPVALLPAAAFFLHERRRRSPSSRTPRTRSPPTSRRSARAWRSWAPRPTCPSSCRWASPTACGSSALRSSSARWGGPQGR
jgi:MFS family permease